MCEADIEEMMTETQRGKYLDWLSVQDAALERIELLLYQMYRLAQQAAVSGDSCDGMGRNLQEEMEALKAQIDQIVADKLRNE